MAVVVALLLFFAAEVAAIVEVALHLGLFTTVALLVLISACGPLVIRRAGLTMWQQARARLQRGEMPGRELQDGALLVVAGLLLCVPGFLSGLFGVLLLLRPIRRGVWRLGGRWLLARSVVGWGGTHVVAARTRNARKAGEAGVDWPGDDPATRLPPGDR